jgi:hypothetical protein
MYWPPQLELQGTELAGRAWGLWGSTGRGEMTALSDWDIFCWSPYDKTFSLQRDAIKKRWRSFGANGYIDLLICESSNLIFEFALTNATDLHAVYFLTSLRGDEERVHLCLEAQRGLHRQKNIRIREIFHLLTTQYAFQILYCPSCARVAKFCGGGTRSWSTLAQMAYFYRPTSEICNTESGLKSVSEIINCNPTLLVKAFRDSWKLRELEETDRGIAFDVLLRRLENMWTGAAGKIISFLLPWIQYHAGVSPNLLSEVLGLIFPCESFAIPSPRCIDPGIENMLRIFSMRSEGQLQAIDYIEFDWWSIHAIVMNKHTPSNCLHALAFPTWKINHHAWRNIRLYVIKHPNVARSTLLKLLDTPGLRSLEYAEIKRRLFEIPKF